MSSQWRPHGLIQDRCHEDAYQAAKMGVDEHGNSKNPKEYLTVNFFEDLFKYVIFDGPYFRVNSQYPPAPSIKGVDTACDIVVKFVDTTYKLRVLCFAEAKRAKNTTRARIRDLENQAQLYCQDFLQANPDEEIIFACTLVGVSVRCWSLTRDMKYMQGFWDGDQKDHFGFYKDVGKDENKQLLEQAFSRMKSVPTSALRIDQLHSQIGATQYSNQATHVPSSTSQTAYAAPSMPVQQTQRFAAYTGPSTTGFSGSAQQFTSMYPSSASTAWNPGQSSSYASSASAAWNPGQSSSSASSAPMAWNSGQSSGFANPYPAGPSFAPAFSTPQLLALRNEDYVSVTLVDRGVDIGSNVYEFMTVNGPLRVRGSEFFEGTDPAGHKCVVYFGTITEVYYWTRTLDLHNEPVPSGKGKGKERSGRGTGRRH